MYRYLICFIICLLIWFFNTRWLIQARRERIKSEIYIHTGFGVFFTILAVESILKIGPRLTIGWFRIAGLLLYIPSAYLVFSSLHALKHKGRSEKYDPTETTAFIDTGIYGRIRQPMTLGMVIWSVALILVFQSVIVLILGVISIFLFWMSARSEGEYNLRKFGDVYKGYMIKIPMWNILRRR